MTAAEPPGLFSTLSPDILTKVVVLEVPSSQVVVLQSYFELCEGLGTVRTLDSSSSLVCIITTDSQIEECYQALLSIRELIPWRSGTELTERVAREGNQESILKGGLHVKNSS